MQSQMACKTGNGKKWIPGKSYDRFMWSKRDINWTLRYENEIIGLKWIWLIFFGSDFW